MPRALGVVEVEAAMDIKPGMKVRVPKGTPIKSTHPSKPEAVAGRDMVVKVNHLLTAWKHLLAYRYDGERLHFQGSHRDQYAVCEAYGLPHRNDVEVQASLESLVSKATVEPYSPGSKTELLWVERSPAKVVWAGTGGYWREAPVAVVVPV